MTAVVVSAVMVAATVTAVVISAVVVAAMTAVVDTRLRVDTVVVGALALSASVISRLDVTAIGVPIFGAIVRRVISAVASMVVNGLGKSAAIVAESCLSVLRRGGAIAQGRYDLRRGEPPSCQRRYGGDRDQSLIESAHLGRSSRSQASPSRLTPPFISQWR
ncbi:MAG: hypothetical protein H0U36_12755 [Nocardioidaceae bacterium]|nr:hypothetical protein [Nocardioidaceae bacterium]